jgi:hypothetical protein
MRWAFLLNWKSPEVQRRHLWLEILTATFEFLQFIEPF